MLVGSSMTRNTALMVRKTWIKKTLLILIKCAMITRWPLQTVKMEVVDYERNTVCLTPVSIYRPQMTWE